MERTVRAPVHARAPIRGPKRLLALRSDARLVELVRAGDAAAFEVLYERHVAGVLGFCRHMLGSLDEAEDAVQQAFVSAHEAMLRGTRDIAFKPWLYTIARNRCLSMLRARREQPSELPELSTAGLSEQVERRDDLRQLVADLQRLPEQQRAALLLGELGDLSHAEIADVIGSAPEAVKGLVFRARTALAERRDARGADCGEIRVELAAATGGGLRRGRLRHHVESCPGCAAYLEEIRRQRQLLGIALPVVPALALKDSVLASVGIGAGSAGAAGATITAGTMGGAAGGAATLGPPLLGGTLAKVAVVGVIAAGGAGVASELARDGGDRPRVAPSSEVGPVGAGREAATPGIADERSGSGASRDRRAGARGAERRELGQRRAAERSGGRSAAGDPRGLARGRSGERRGRSGAAPGRAVRGRTPAAAPGRPSPPAKGGGKVETQSGRSTPEASGGTRSEGLGRAPDGAATPRAAPPPKAQEAPLPE